MSRLAAHVELTVTRRQYQQLSAVLAAVLLKVGPVELTDAEAEAEHATAELHYERDPVSKSMRVWVTV